MEFDVTIEIPRGSSNKYVIDRPTGRLRLDRTLFTATRYPADYGFIDETCGTDIDALDALVLVREPTFPGCLVRCRAFGVFRMHDEQGATPKVMCVPAGDPRLTQLTDIGDLDHFYRLEIQHFFQIYKALEPGKRVEVEDDAWAGRDVAEMEIRRALDHATATTTMDRADPSPAESVDAELVGRLVERARTAGLRLTGEGGLPQQLTKRVLEAALDGEITDHVGSCPVAN